jgi:hypothetical protein
MWLDNILDLAAKAFPIDPLAGIEDAVTRLNPDRFYPENVQELLGVSRKRAERICETAVRQGLFAHCEDAPSCYRLVPSPGGPP